MALYRGKWHGKDCYFGLHYDLHAGKGDTELGAHCAPGPLAAELKLMAPEWVQTDCKGHPGYTSWFSKVPEASVSPGVKQDAMKGWRAATKRLGVPLHCHYSGIWDGAAAAKHPEWAVVRKDEGAPKEPSQKMCPRSPYVDQLLIPQMLELIDDYGVDGFWVDGELWAVEPCYCDRCTAAYVAETGLAAPPTKRDDPQWARWMDFTRHSFEAYVAHYCDVVHAHSKRALICSNWLQTFKHPGPPTVPTDWVSGDNSWSWGMDSSRCEARFISTRGKPWDIMLWAFYCSHGMCAPGSPWAFKPPEMLMQEAAVTLALGGNVQIYEHPPGLRTGQLIPWRMRALGEVGRFVKARRTVCQDTETIPQVAVLHSETHLRQHYGLNLMWDTDVAPVQGAVFSLLECHYGVDILDEWALTPRLAEFPVVVVPERHDLAAEMVTALKSYVKQGGRLLVTGAGALDRFGADFLGVEPVKTVEKAMYYVPGKRGADPVTSDRWLLLKPTHARGFGRLGTTPLVDERLTDHPAATINRVGKGRVGYVPCDVFRYFNHNRYPCTREFIAAVTAQVAGRLDLQVSGPTCVDVVLRRRGPRLLYVHFINRSSGLPNAPNSPAIDEVPGVGPVVVRMRLPHAPRAARVRLDAAPFDYGYDEQSGWFEGVIFQVGIHCALEIRL